MPDIFCLLKQVPGLAYLQGEEIIQDGMGDGDHRATQRLVKHRY